MGFLLKQRGTVRVELAEGFVVWVKPFGAADVDVASAKCAQALVDVQLGKASLARYGLSSADGAKLTYLESRGASSTMLAIELGEEFIERWEGPEVETGEMGAEGNAITAPAPLDRASIALAFNAWGPPGPRGENTSWGQHFLNKVSALSVLEPAAKNVSTVSPTTSTGEAVNGAETAERQSSPAPAASA